MIRTYDRHIDYASLAIMFLAFSFLFGLLSPDFTVSYGDSEAALAYIKLANKQSALSQAGGSAFNQLFWLSLLGASLVLIALRANDVLRYLPGLLLLLALAGFCLLSVLWSGVPDITIRRSLFLLVIIMTLFIALSYAPSLKSVLMAIYAAAALTLLLDLVALALPSGFHSGGAADLGGLFKGIHGHKNTVGPIGTLAIYIGIWVRSALARPRARVLNGAFIVAWFALVLLSGSKTSIALFLLAPLLVSLAGPVARAMRLPVAIVLFGNILILLFGLGLADALFNADVADVLTYITGIEVTFTGRTDLWAFVLAQLDGHWLLGFGYGGFWGIGLNAATLTSASAWFSTANEAHNGYLDIVVNIGLAGAVLFFAVLASFASQMEKLRPVAPKSHFLLWTIMTFCLLHNMQESSIIRTTHLVWVMMVFTVLVSARLARDTQTLSMTTASRAALPAL